MILGQMVGDAPWTRAFGGIAAKRRAECGDVKDATGLRASGQICAEARVLEYK